MRGKFTGFTLIELIVVIAIMAVFMALALPRFFTFNKGQDLQNEAETLKSALRTAQNNAASGTIKCTDPAVSSSNWFINFLEKSSDHTIYYQMGELCSDSSTVMSEPYYLTKNVVINTIGLNSCDGVDLKTDNPKISFGNISGSISFSHELSGQCLINDLTKKMVVNLISSDDSSESVNVNIEKGGSIYISSN